MGFAKSRQEREWMREAGNIVAGLLKLMAREAKPGITTQRLDEIAEDFILSQNGEPLFKGYYGYPASICTSVNEEVIHGIPGKRVLRDGDIIGVDVGVRYKNYCADAARTFAVGNIDSASKKLLEVTQEALRRGIEQAKAGNRIGDISWAVQSYAEKEGFSVVREYVGHGIGKNLHEEPQVPNYGRPHEGVKIVEGMALAIEPMINQGALEVTVLADGWTVVTKDRKRSAHFEQTVFAGKMEAEIITE